MVMRIGGGRRKSRHKLLKKAKEKGKISLKNYLQTFNEGDKVLLKAEPSIQKGMYHLRFHGKAGTIKGRKGECYLVKIYDKTKPKELIVHPIHLRRI